MLKVALPDSIIYRALIPVHDNLKFAGMLPPLDAPHHLRASEWGRYREGVVRNTSLEEGSFVDVGLDKDAYVSDPVREGVRVTLYMGDNPEIVEISGRNAYSSRIVPPQEPRVKDGQYWGYITRIATCIEDVFSECPFDDRYDITIGTSERGEKVGCCNLRLKQFRHALIVIGGPQGLEYALENDPWASKYPDRDPSILFDRYLNTCENQGSRTIRTEEALLITMAFLTPALASSGH